MHRPTLLYWLDLPQTNWVSKTVMIAPYIPELASVKIVFNQIKNKMKASLRDCDTNFVKKEGIMTLFRSLFSLSAIQI